MSSPSALRLSSAHAAIRSGVAGTIGGLAEAVGATAERGGRAVEDRGSAPVDIPHGDAHAGDLDEQRRLGCDHAEPAGLERRAEWRFQDDGATVWRHCTGLDQAAHARRAYREVARVGM